MFEQAVTAGPGTATYTQHTFEILVMLFGAFLLGLWLGWLLWSKYKQQVESLELENRSLQGNVHALQNDMALLKTAKQQLQISEQQLKEENADLESAVDDMSGQLDDLSSTLGKSKAERQKLENELINAKPSTPESAAVPMEVVHSDVDVHIEDLTPESAPDPMDEGGELEVVEPQVLTGVDISVDSDPLVEGGEVEAEAEGELEVIEPETEIPVRMVLSPENLAEGGAVSPAADDTTERAIDVPPADLVVVNVNDNMKIIEGVGPKIEEVLFKNGINTYSQLAATPVSRIKEMLLNEGNRFSTHDPSTWPAQALLAANEEWNNLKAYQSYLHGGRKPD